MDVSRSAGCEAGQAVTDGAEVLDARPGRLARALGVLARRLRVNKKPEHHGAGSGRGIPAVPLVTADHFLLLGDELSGLFPRERDRTALHHPGPAAPPPGPPPAPQD